MSDSHSNEPMEVDEDPFAAFDGAVGMGAVRDPYPIYREMRAECPVHAGEQAHRFGVETSASAFLYQGATPHTVVQFELGQDVLKDGGTFSSSILARVTGLIMGRTIIEMDEPDHRRYRALISRAFTPHAMERWERDIVVPVVDRQIDAIAGRGQAELVRDLFFPYPMHVISQMLGLPEEDLPAFHRKAAELIGIMVDAERGMAASQWLHDYFAEIITARRATPQQDLITMLVEAELDGQQLTDDEIIAFLRLLLPAGGETTYRSSSNLMYGLLTHPDQLEKLRADRSLVPRAVEEALRWEPPIASAIRITTRDVDLGGVSIPEGCPVEVYTGCANHDEERWQDADEFDVLRDPQPHLAFGFGQHVCLGMHLARTEMRVVTEAILDRLPNIRLDPAAEDLHITGLGMRAPTALPVLFDVV